MTEPYKKRAKAGYNSNKDESNRAERRYDEIDIDDQLAEDSKVTGKHKPNKKPTKYEKEVKSMIREVRMGLYFGKGSISGLNNRVTEGGVLCSMMLGYLRRAKEAIPKLREAVKSDVLPAKLKRLAKEMLDMVGDEL